MNPGDILTEYGIDNRDCRVEALSSGLINSTWKVSSAAKEYVVQKINTSVFKEPYVIGRNLELLSAYLEQFPEYLFAGPIKNKNGKSLTTVGEDVYRIFPYISNSYTVERVTSSQEAFEAASQFGRFTFMLKDFDPEKLGITIPDFHNIAFRYGQFTHAIRHGNPERIRQSQELIAELQSHKKIIDEFEAIKRNPEFITRVTHHDTKISNVLFDQNGTGLCVIDLDTVMPGYFFSDVGDMMRTYLSPTTEEETDFSKIHIRDEMYHAIKSGYLSGMKAILTDAEKQSFFYAGKFMVYMQALRFATDFLNDDIYYGAKYRDHNFNRANNQLVLLEKLIEKEPVLNRD